MPEVQGTVQRGAANAEVAGDGGDRLAALAAGPGDGQGVLADGGGAAATAALVPGGRGGRGALADQVAFHLRGHRGDHEQHLVGERSAATPG